MNLNAFVPTIALIGTGSGLLYWVGDSSVSELSENLHRTRLGQSRTKHSQLADIPIFK